jgi:hypothetical protein
VVLIDEFPNIYDTGPIVCGSGENGFGDFIGSFMLPDDLCSTSSSISGVF